MRLGIWIVFSLRELWGQKRFSVFFTLNLMLGLLGFVALESVKSSVEYTITQNSKNILGADIKIGGRREFLPEERAVVDSKLKNQPRALMLEIYSMLVAQPGSRLVQVRGIEDVFPFYGKFKLQTSGLASGYNLSSGEIWVYPELIAQLGIKIGDEVQIGEKKFRVRDVIEDDVGALWSSFSLAPRIYMKLEDLKLTQLIRTGSLVTYNYLYKVVGDEEALAQDIAAQFTDQGMRVMTHRKSSEQSARFLSYFNDYLALIAIVTLVLSSIGSIFLIRGFLQTKIRELSILVSLGLDIGKAQSVFIFQIFILCLLATCAAFLGGVGVFPYLQKILASVLNLEIQYQISTQSLIMLFTIGIVGNLIVFLPLFMRIQTLSPSLLFQEASGREWASSSIKSIIYALPSVLYFWILSVLQAHSIKNGSYFFVGLLVGGLGLYALGVGVLKLFEKFEVRSLGFSMSLRFLARNKQSTLSSFLALSLGATILCLIPQIEMSLKSEIRQPETSLVPSLILFDIQEEQVSDLQKVLQEQGQQLNHISPLIRARLEKINGQDVEKSASGDSRYFREDEQSERFKNRTFNLSYRQVFSNAEEIVSGRAFSTNIGAIAEISLEEKFAESLNLKLKDRLVFDVQGISVEGEVVSLRRIKWTSFHPNFFVQFQEGFLESAPKTYLASINKLIGSERVNIQSQISKNFSNISIVDVSRVLEKIMDLIQTLSIVLSLMAVLSLITGLVVLVSIVTYQVQSKFIEMTLFKVLGATPFQLQRVFVIESSLIGGAAAILGASLGLIFSYLVSKYIFDGVWVADIKAMIGVILMLTFLSGLSSYLGSFVILRKEKIF